MVYSVELSFRARRDLEQIVAYISANSPRNAARWRRRLQEKLRSLSTMPTACGLAPEDQVSGREIRQLLFGTYRVLFTIYQTKVFVLTVRHGARRLLTADELDGIGP
jgi:plasmid stabilization system protein ParE